ncbi:triose-phosphate isomerase, partial [bacterium]|nr:triose-phosphate isomerase [bacterium]
MKRKPFIAANWKMHKSIEEGISFFNSFHEKVKNISDRETGLCVPYTMLYEIGKLKKHLNSPIALGAENMHFEEQGAFTGEISHDMLLECGVDYVIIGHSERRHVFGETDEVLNKKMHKLQSKNQMKAIFCIGELLEEREAGKTNEVLRRQMKQGLDGITKEFASTMVVAYEPVWAIGTGVSATKDDAVNAITFVRKELNELYDEETAQKIRIQYGGSVKPNNIHEYMDSEEIDGALVGG